MEIEAEARRTGSTPEIVIKIGIDAVREAGPKYPPNLIEFLRMVRDRDQGSRKKSSNRADYSWTEQRIAKELGCHPSQLRLKEGWNEPEERLE